MRRRIVQLARIFIGVAALLGLLELGLRLASSDADAYFIWPAYFERLMEPSPEVFPGVSGPALFSVNSRGLRADELLPGDEPVLLAVGGSTTECQVLDQAEAWPQLVADALSAGARHAWVGNAGRSGHTTREHLFQVPVLLDAFPRTDVLLLLAGANDLGLVLKQGAEYDPRFLERNDVEALQIPRSFRETPRAYAGQLPVLKRTEVYAGLRRLKNWVIQRWGLHGTASRGEAIARWRSNRRQAPELIAQLPDLGPALAEYERNLTAIVEACRARGVTPVLMTQPSIWRADLEPTARDRLWWGGVGDYQAQDARVPFYSVEALAAGMELYNRALLAVAAATGAPSLDLAAAIPKTAACFFDDMHFTEAGARDVARVVAAFLRERQLVDD